MYVLASATLRQMVFQGRFQFRVRAFRQHGGRAAVQIGRRHDMPYGRRLAAQGPIDLVLIRGAGARPAHVHERGRQIQVPGFAGRAVQIDAPHDLGRIEPEVRQRRRAGTALAPSISTASYSSVGMPCRPAR